MTKEKSVYIKKTVEKFDAIVVGSGITGGWAAKELCEKGLKTLMIERGRPVDHGKDYVGEGIEPWKMPFRGLVETDLINKNYFIQKNCYAFEDSTKHFFGSDRDIPISTPEGKPFNWIRGNQIGGKSLLWYRQSYRWSDLDFKANLMDGHGIDWPIRYKDLEPWYSYVEKHVGISGSIENIPVLPDGEFLPPYEFNSVEKIVKEKIESIFPERKLIMGRTANLSTPSQQHIEQGRGKCQSRNECRKGCSYGAYFSTQSSTLPAALKTKKLSIAVNSVVHSVIFDKKTGRAAGVRVIDADTFETREYFAKIIFLCASTLATTQIMLNSKCEIFPNGIANSSGVLGHYLMDHLAGSGAGGFLEGYKDEYYFGRRPTGLYMPRFRNVDDKRSDYLRGYAFFSRAERMSWKSGHYKDGFGEDFKKNIRTSGDGWLVGFYGNGEMLPRYENFVSLHSTKTDKWGMPVLHIDCSYSDNDLKMHEDMNKAALEMLNALGAKNVWSLKVKTSFDIAPGLTIHEMGTARMGKSPKESVLNSHNQCHDVPNLFVTDGACMTSGAWQNPSLTYMALTARACDYAVEQLKIGNL